MLNLVQLKHCQSGGAWSRWRPLLEAGILGDLDTRTLELLLPRSWPEQAELSLTSNSSEAGMQVLRL